MYVNKFYIRTKMGRDYNNSFRTIGLYVREWSIYIFKLLFYRVDSALIIQ